jgi:nitronate monooxygenase
MAVRDLALQLGIEHPVMQAAMGGGPSTPELIAAVSSARGMGWLGAAYLTPEQIGDTINRIRALTDRPFGVNLFAGGREDAGRLVDPVPILDLLTEIHGRLGLPPPEIPVLPTDQFADQVAVVLEARPAAFGFTFGIPAPEVLRGFRARHIATVGTATTPTEARLLADAGVDVILAQGSEAGAHRGTFAGAFASSMVPTLQLVGAVRALTQRPIIASGGLMDRSDIVAVLSAGADAAALGTAFLATPESGASGPYKRAVLAATRDTTVVTRAFSGRPARALGNRFTDLLAGRDEILMPFPLQNALTRPMRNAAAALDQPAYLSLYAGTGVARASDLTAVELVRSLIP